MNITMRQPFREDLMVLDPLGLVGCRCGNCGVTSFPTRSMCPSCKATSDLQKTTLSDTGTVYSYTVVRQAPPGQEVPYVLAYVDLPEGVRLLTRLECDDIEAVQIGMAVHLAERSMETSEDGITLIGYQFVPLEQEGSAANAI